MMVIGDDKVLYSDCCQYAMKYISRFPKTEKELLAKLYQKGFNTAQVNYTIDFLKRKKFLGDDIYVESYVRSELVNKGKPEILVRTKLRLKGVDKSLIDKIIKNYSSDILAGIHEKIKKEVSNYKKKGLEGFDIISKLARKGYKLDDIKSALMTSDRL